MNHLVPCPSCARHVRQSEAACPFCATELSLEQLSPPALPRTRLGRAATFAFGASLVGATSLVACGGESETVKPGGDGGANSLAGSSNAAGHAGAGGHSAGTFNGFGGNIAQPYGVPPFGGMAPTYGVPPFGGAGAGGGGAGGTSGASGTSGAGGGGGMSGAGGSSGAAGSSGHGGGGNGGGGNGGASGHGGGGTGGAPGTVYGSPP